jgi:hypothetical protein
METKLALVGLGKMNIKIIPLFLTIILLFAGKSVNAQAVPSSSTAPQQQLAPKAVVNVGEDEVETKAVGRK